MLCKEEWISQEDAKRRISMSDGIGSEVVLHRLCNGERGT